MSILDRFKKGKAIPASVAFRLTQEGRDKLHDYTGDTNSRILLALETRGSCDLNEISQTSGLGRGQVERAIPYLTRNRYVSYAHSGSEDVSEE